MHRWSGEGLWNVQWHVRPHHRLHHECCILKRSRVRVNQKAIYRKNAKKTSKPLKYPGRSCTSYRYLNFFKGGSGHLFSSPAQPNGGAIRTSTSTHRHHALSTQQFSGRERGEERRKKKRKEERKDQFGNVRRRACECGGASSAISTLWCARRAEHAIYILARRNLSSFL